MKGKKREGRKREKGGEGRGDIYDMYVNGLFIGVIRLYRGVNSSLSLHRCVDRVYILKQVGVNRLYIGVNREC